MKYEVGDKVVNQGDLEMLFNPYWKTDYRKSLIKTVTEATDKFFTIYNSKGSCSSTIENGFSCGAHEYLNFWQDTGYQRGSKIRLLHLEKDNELIRKSLSDVGNEQYKKDVESENRQINYHNRRLVLIEEAFNQDVQINYFLLGLAPEPPKEITP